MRASWQHQHIVNAIHNVVQRRADDPVAIVAGFSPTVLDCDDYRDALGHLTHEGAIAVAKEIGISRSDDAGVALLHEVPNIVGKIPGHVTD